MRRGDLIPHIAWSHRCQGHHAASTTPTAQLHYEFRSEPQSDQSHRPRSRRFVSPDTHAQPTQRLCELQPAARMHVVCGTTNHLLNNIQLGAALVPRLQQLDLSHNLIQRLPDCIVGLIQLQRINLECCQLQRLPVAIGGLPLLRVLQIKENRHMKWPPRAVVPSSPACSP